MHHACVVKLSNEARNSNEFNVIIQSHFLGSKVPIENPPGFVFLTHKGYLQEDSLPQVSIVPAQEFVLPTYPHDV